MQSRVALRSDRVQEGRTMHLSELAIMAKVLARESGVVKKRISHEVNAHVPAQ